MSILKNIENKIYTFNKLKTKLALWKKKGEKIVFTNGCFDILHKGHIECLAKASEQGTKLIVALNSDNSIKKNKGEDRPILDQTTRSTLLASLTFIDAVILFDEETPIELISDFLPNVLVKGNDYKIEDVIGNEIVRKNGGKIVLIPLVKGVSSTKIINDLKQS